METALIIGCGYTGAGLAGRLAETGVHVVGTGTGPEAPADLPVAWRQLDLLADGPLELPEAADAVVYYMVSTLTRRYDGEARPHLAPLSRCIGALERQPPRRLVYLSSTSVYGDRAGAWVDEASPVQPASPWGRMRVELERSVWQFGEERGVSCTVVRLPEIYGPGRGPLERLRSGYVVRAPERYSNRIHIDDLALVLQELGKRPAPDLLLVADDEPAPTLEVYRFAAERLGMGAGAVGVSTTGPIQGDANRRALITESKRCDNRRLRQWLGRPLRYPSYREGITAILAHEARGG